MKRLLLAVAAFFMACMAQAQSGVYKEFSPGGDLAGAGSSWNVQFLAPGAVTLAKEANYAANSIRGNVGAAGVGQDLVPGAACILMNCVGNAIAATTANITLSGPQTIDTISVTQGQLVLVQSQTTAADNGLYRVQSGAWTRDNSLPVGYVIAQNCAVSIFVQSGALYGGYTVRLFTNGGYGPITIGTTAQTWVRVSLPAASTVAAGTVKISAANSVAAAIGTATNAFDCVDFTAAGLPSPGNEVALADDGNTNGTQGPCVVADVTTGHIVLNDAGTAPTVSAGSVDSAASDEGGIITGLSAATTVTLTFSGKWTLPASSTARYAHCTANDSAGTVVGVVPNSNGLSVVFSMAALTGTLSYNCF